MICSQRYISFERAPRPGRVEDREPLISRQIAGPQIFFGEQLFEEVEIPMTTVELDEKLARALALIGTIDPEIEESWSSLEARILAQAMENVELAEQRLREIQDLVGERVLVACP